jgi:hypothetical protein
MTQIKWPPKDTSVIVKVAAKGSLGRMRAAS